MYIHCATPAEWNKTTSTGPCSDDAPTVTPQCLPFIDLCKLSYERRVLLLETNSRILTHIWLKRSNDTCLHVRTQEGVGPEGELSLRVVDPSSLDNSPRVITMERYSFVLKGLWIEVPPNDLVTPRERLTVGD